MMPTRLGSGCDTYMPPFPCESRRLSLVFSDGLFCQLLGTDPLSLSHYVPSRQRPMKFTQARAGHHHWTGGVQGRGEHAAV